MKKGKRGKDEKWEPQTRRTGRWMMPIICGLIKN